MPHGSYRQGQHRGPACTHITRPTQKDGLGTKSGEKSIVHLQMGFFFWRIPAIPEANRSLGKLHELKACKMVCSTAGRGQRGKLLLPTCTLTANAQMAAKSKVKHTLVEEHD